MGIVESCVGILVFFGCGEAAFFHVCGFRNCKREWILSFLRGLGFPLLLMWQFFFPQNLELDFWDRFWFFVCCFCLVPAALMVLQNQWSCFLFFWSFMSKLNVLMLNVCFFLFWVNYSLPSYIFI